MSAPIPSAPPEFGINRTGDASCPKPSQTADSPKSGTPGRIGRDDRLFRKHIWPVLLGLGGFLIVAYDALSRAQQMWTLGLPGWALETLGFGLIFVAVVRFFFEIHMRVSATEASVLHVESAQPLRNPQSIPDQLEWTDLWNIDQFVDQEVLFRRREAYAQHSVAEKEYALVSEEMEKTVAAQKAYWEDEGNDNLDEFLDVNKRLSEYSASAEAAKKAVAEWDNKCKSASYLVDYNLKKKLLSGELVARGFVLPHVAGTAPQNIPSAEWDLLKLDEFGGCAEGEGIKYVGVRIARPPPVPVARPQEINQIRGHVRHALQSLLRIGQKTLR